MAWDIDARIPAVDTDVGTVVTIYARTCLGPSHAVEQIWAQFFDQCRGRGHKITRTMLWPAASYLVGGDCKPQQGGARSVCEAVTQELAQLDIPHNLSHTIQQRRARGGVNT